MSQNHPPGTPSPGPSPFPTPPGPTHPTPTGPQRPTPRSGHLPPGDVSMSRTAGHAYPLPRLDELVRDVERACEQLVNMLGRPIDPTSVFADEVFQDGMRNVDAILGAAVGHVWSAVREIKRLPAYGPPAGGAVQYPARQGPVEADGGLRIATQPGGPLTTGVVAGECRSPGYAAAVPAAASESEAPVRASQATSLNGAVR